ncbi:MAG: hypothetical protein AAF171_00610 [Cyanobacteria bacterium P01_A01_bin.116]
MRHRSFSVLICYIFALVCLFCSYFAFNANPPWMQDILWTKDPTLLCLLEAGCLISVAFIFSFSDILPHVHTELRPLESNILTAYKKESLEDSASTPRMSRVFLAISALAFPYAIYKIYLGESIGIRFSYSLFAFFLQLFWLHLTRNLLLRPILNLWQVLNVVISDPLSIFSLGRSLSPTLNALAVSVSLITFPFLFVLPTLPVSQPTFPINQRLIAAFLGILICLTLLISYLFMQSITLNSLNKSLIGIDQYSGPEKLDR